MELLGSCWMDLREILGWQFLLTFVKKMCLSKIRHITGTLSEDTCSYRTVLLLQYTYKKSFAKVGGKYLPCERRRFHENLSIGDQVVSHGRTDTTNLIVAFRNFANAPKNSLSIVNLLLWYSGNLPRRKQKKVAIDCKSAAKIRRILGVFCDVWHTRSFSCLLEILHEFKLLGKEQSRTLQKC